ncbi:hypothetical protein ABZX34_08235 [Streptomyces sp. NPDC004362]|uniref:hypothetical protein n=1 Tax=Streptomyces sp. NPDC004362 TaxID=3154456 RepID=UPI0033A03C7C
MISTRRIVAAVGLAIGVTGLAVPMASAAPADNSDASRLNPVTMLDSLSHSEVPEQYKEDVPLPSRQLGELNRVNDIQPVRQATAKVAPVTGLVSGVAS